MAADLRLHRLAGLVLSSPSVHEVLASASLPQVPGQGRVTIGPEVSDTPTVWIDFASFFDQAVKHLVERGRRRIAMISYQGFARQCAALFETTLAVPARRRVPTGSRSRTSTIKPASPAACTC